MKETKGYQGVMETMYISTLERSVEMKGSESGPTALTVQMEPTCLSQELTAPLVGRKSNAGYFKWWWLIVMITVRIKEKLISGIFLRLNLKDLEHSLGSRRPSGIVRGRARGQATLSVSQQQE